MLALLIAIASLILIVVVIVTLHCINPGRGQRLDGLGPTAGNGRMPSSVRQGGGAGLAKARSGSSYTNPSFVQPPQVPVVVPLTPNAMYASADRPSTVQLVPNAMYASADVDQHARVDRNGPIYVGGNTNIADAGANIIYAIPLNDEDPAAATSGGGGGSAARNNVYDAGVPQRGAQAASNNIYDAGTPRRNSHRRSNNTATSSSA